MPNPIPTRTREIVTARDAGHCLRCGGGANLELHHRRRRGVRDGNEHGSENVVSLCGQDHRWVHDNPAAARVGGFIVSAFEVDVAAVVLESYMGNLLLLPDGSIAWAS